MISAPLQRHFSNSLQPTILRRVSGASHVSIVNYIINYTQQYRSTEAIAVLVVRAQAGWSLNRASRTYETTLP